MSEKCEYYQIDVGYGTEVEIVWTPRDGDSRFDIEITGDMYECNEDGVEYPVGAFLHAVLNPDQVRIL